MQTLLSIRLALYFVIFQFAVWFLSLVERSMSEPMGRLFGTEQAVQVGFGHGKSSGAGDTAPEFT